ncbi:hypothetical protein A0J61_11476 [Choanephora cucurbitarum]|uniref:Retrotransposon gag domain-containing protein n=1 Tax=Choanephora cucurbitarum TaxID=101091 RepID=A0A1C7MUA7_9FUNG|nr:hypothetical protein A0J61_11476 [Choanephora cucurbitarum]
MKALKISIVTRNFTGGNDGNEAAIWLRKLERLKISAKLSDEEIFAQVNNWDEFVSAFRKQYLQNQEDKWWNQLHALRQGGEYPIVDDLALKMQKIFGLLDNKTERFQVRTVTRKTVQKKLIPAFVFISEILNSIKPPLIVPYFVASAVGYNLTMHEADWSIWD